VAQQSGIAPHLIAEAKEQVDEGILRTDQLLVEIQDEKIELEEIRHQQAQELQKLRQLQNQQKSQIGRLEQKLQKQTERNTENDRLLYWGQRFQKLVESWLDSGSQKDKKQVVSRFVGMLNQRASETEKTDQQTHQKESRAHEKKLRRFLEEPIHEGQEVKVLSSGMKGTVVAIKGDKYKLALGGNMTAQLERDQFIRADAPLGKPSSKKEKAPGPAKAKKPPKKGQGAEEPRNKEGGPEKAS
jgi:DNA mismatch repair protein MutS2